MAYEVINPRLILKRFTDIKLLKKFWEQFFPNKELNWKHSRDELVDILAIPPNESPEEQRIAYINTLYSFDIIFNRAISLKGLKSQFTHLKIKLDSSIESSQKTIADIVLWVYLKYPEKWEQLVLSYEIKSISKWARYNLEEIHDEIPMATSIATFIGNLKHVLRMDKLAEDSATYEIFKYDPTTTAYVIVLNNAYFDESTSSLEVFLKNKLFFLHDEDTNQLMLYSSRMEKDIGYFAKIFARDILNSRPIITPTPVYNLNTFKTTNLQLEGNEFGIELAFVSELRIDFIGVQGASIKFTNKYRSVYETIRSKFSENLFDLVEIRKAGLHIQMRDKNENLREFDIYISDKGSNIYELPPDVYAPINALLKKYRII